MEESGERDGLMNRFFEGYCLKRELEGVPLSVHLLSADAFDIISKCFVADIRVYRMTPKKGNYVVTGFEGQEYNYFIKNIDLSELRGVRTIVPISFINADRYFIGVHRDKLLTNPLILYETGDYVERHLDELWSVVVENLVDESFRLMGEVDLNRMNVLNALLRSSKMSPSAQDLVREKTDFYLAKIK